MKLNYKKTIYVGFAFFLICAFWQAYDSTVPLILTNKFGLSQTASGIIMALDNILALVLLPLFGAISDKHTGKRGRRTPFILIGTIAAALLFTAMSFADAAQLRNIEKVSKVDDPAALEVIYDAEGTRTLKTPEGERFVLSELFTKEEFLQIRSTMVKGEQNDSLPFSDTELKEIEKYQAGDTFTNPHYTDYVVPARQAYAHDMTKESPTALIVFIVLLLLVLFSMAIFRSPAVALMPDVTIKPLRSKANAVINLMGTAGGIIVLILGMVFATGKVENAMMRYTVYYGVIALIMLLALAVFMRKVREPELVRQMHEESRRYGIGENEEDGSGSRKLSRSERRSLFFLLASIVLWFMGYNAVTSKYSVYAGSILNKDYNLTLIIAQAAAVASYLPVGMIASKVGRKKTILAGIVMLTAAFGVAAFLRQDDSTLLMNAMFALAGIGWATINVNSFPMVVEMCRGGDVGKYTGIYYTASMAAQTITPVLSGRLMDKNGMTILFPYAAVAVALAFVTMFFVMHGDNKPEAKRGLEALDAEV